MRSFLPGIRMSALDHVSAPKSASLLRFAPGVFAATLFLSALLLFAVQPMFTKMVLPRLGGAQSVWSVAMVFFQAALLLGYFYAHLVARAGQGRGALIHLALLAIAALVLPIGIAAGFAEPPQNGLYGWVFALFAASVGLPFVALAASAPLLQSWFAASGHPHAQNPYVLYAASNLGSFAALLAYPIVIEPWLPLSAQSAIWSAGFALLALMVAAAGVLVSRSHGGITPAAMVARGPAVTTRDRARWTMLAAIPSGLCVGVTAYITTDVASAPLLWVIPLALYLLTFVAVFRDRPWFSHEIVVRLVPILLAPLAVSVLGGDKEYWFITILLNLFAFFLLTLMCHGELYRTRPEPARLTEFYLWTSFGGVVGGVFSGLVAPQIFNSTYEYPILFAAAFLAMPGTFAQGPRAFFRALLPWVLLVVLVAGVAVVFEPRVPADAGTMVRIGLILLVAVMLWQRNRPAPFFGLMVLVLVLSELWRPGQTRVERARSFFGVHAVTETANREFRLLVHGTTIHGAERIRNADGSPVAGRPEPLTYYYFGGAISEAIAAKRNAAGGLRSVAAVGLGSGSLACHKQGAEQWSFFEIDPEVARIARDPQRFRFLSECGPDIPITLGDARLTLAASPRTFDLIVLDAFSSDSIPVHLLTREAFAGYLSRLAPTGTLTVHISNRHLELARVVAAVGRTHGLIAFVKRDKRSLDFSNTYRANSLVAVLARRESDLGPLDADWRRVDPDPNVPPWTDDYSDVLRAILRLKGWM
jgi:hypothetical protein